MDIYTKLKEMRILLVDDDEWIRDSFTLLMESEGCHLKAVETAEDGLAALQNEKFDIIITDYWLPGMNGLEFLSRIYDSNRNVIKILITAYGSASISEEAQRLGVHTIIAKPFSSETFENVLQRLLEEAGEYKN